MGIVSGIAVFFMIWWTALFAVLPWGIRHPDKLEKGMMPGAPLKPNIKKIVIVNTILTIIIWLVIYALVKSDLISFQRIARDMV